MGKKEQLEEAMNRFLKDQTMENQNEMIRQMLLYVFFVPGVFPNGTTIEDMKPKRPGEKVTLPPEKRPFPAVIKNSNGEYYVPAYLDQAGIKADPKPEVVLQMPFLALADLTVRNPQMTGVAINPFTQNILMKRPGLEKLLRDMAPKKTPPATPLFKLETEIFPKELYRDPRSFMERLENEEGAFLIEVAENAGKGLSLPKLKEEDFSVMALNIRDALTLIRLDIPMENRPTKVCRIYLLLNEDGGDTAYYTVETVEGKQGTRIFHTDKKGKRSDAGEGPTEGAEMSRVLELYDELFGKEEA